MTLAHVSRLRQALREAGFDGWIQPRADEFQGEYVPASAARLAWLTGFTGSAGVSIILKDKAAVFSDGRYSIQLKEQIDLNVFQPCHLVTNPADDWVSKNLAPGEILAYDPWLLTEAEVKRFDEAAAKAGGSVAAAKQNLVDKIWLDRPPPPATPILPHPLEFSGVDAVKKQEEVASKIAESGATAALLTQPDSIAWILNVRGSDVEHTPLPLSFAVLGSDASIQWFVNPDKLDEQTRNWVGKNAKIEHINSFADSLKKYNDKSILVSESAPAAALEILRSNGANVIVGKDPVALPKAIKNKVEISGARAAHKRDAKAVIRFLHWLSTEGQSGEVTEIEASDRLESFRRGLDLFKDLSFPTISGAGENGAIIHYRASEAKEFKLQRNSLYLCDSGAQFLDGTTDITRTIAIGLPSEDMRRTYTLVLKGHLALSAARFPKGTTGTQLDTLARAPLWEAGLDFDHGTGHGVGSYLSVHEGPHRVSKAVSNVALAPGMILSNEPGYYRAGSFGIRIENLLLVTEIDIPGSEHESYGFETLTLAPYDRNLIDTSLLSQTELEAIDLYHARVRNELAEHLSDDEAGWLISATAPL
jgi:Xaa-Pro aminopeptidase